MAKVTGTSAKTSKDRPQSFLGPIWTLALCSQVPVTLVQSIGSRQMIPSYELATDWEQIARG
jgi:hypothetical protein